MKLASIAIAVSLLCAGCFAQADPTQRSWNQPVEPFRIIGNIYYVGASDITSYLITSPKGHILLDGGLVETAPQIRDNIRKLGFKVEDVKILINSHSHYDHAAGLAELKKATGATLVASKEEERRLRVVAKAIGCGATSIRFRRRSPTARSTMATPSPWASRDDRPHYSRTYQGCTTWTMNTQPRKAGTLMTWSSCAVRALPSTNW